MTRTHIEVDTLVPHLVNQAVQLYREVLEAKADAEERKVRPDRVEAVRAANARLNGACEVLASMWRLLGADEQKMDAAMARRIVVQEHKSPSAPKAAPAGSSGPAPDSPEGEALIAVIASRLELERTSATHWFFELEERRYHVRYNSELPVGQRYVVWGPGFNDMYPISREGSLTGAVFAAVAHNLMWGHRQYSKVLRQAAWLESMGLIGEAMAAHGS